MVNTARQGMRQRSSYTPNLRARTRDWIERDIRFVELAEFAQADPAARIQASRPSSLDDTDTVACSEPGVTFVTGLVDSPLLSPAEEVYLFKWMNFLKFRAEQCRRLLNLNRPDHRLIDRIEVDLRESVEFRNRIVRSNLRLVVALARKLTDNLDQMSELIAEATIPLIRAVELFDVGLGNRFSTYATWAVRNQMLRCVKRRQTTLDRIVSHDQLWMDRVPDERSNPEEEARASALRTESVQRLLMELSDRERLVVTARFGLEGQPRGQSLQDIAERIGLSKERVRQIALSAIEKLQGIAKATGSIKSISLSPDSGRE